MTNCISKIDLHMHTTVSDGTDSPEEILARVKAEGIQLFSVTDHDAVKAGQIIRGLLKEGDPRFITGVEFSCKDEEGKYHILGYNFDPYSPAIQETVGHGHKLRMNKVLRRLGFLKTEFGFSFPDEELKQLLTMDNPGKPHIANMMVRHGYAETKEQAIRDFINRLRFRSEYIRPEEAIAGILAAGGIPVLAHPPYGSGDELILGADLEHRVNHLMAFGLQGLEAFYSGFTEKLHRGVLSLAERYDLYVTAGSDYHGANKLVLLGDTGLDDTSEFPDGLKRFLRCLPE